MEERKYVLRIVRKYRKKNLCVVGMHALHNIPKYFKVGECCGYNVDFITFSE